MYFKNTYIVQKVFCQLVLLKIIKNVHGRSNLTKINVEPSDRTGAETINNFID